MWFNNKSTINKAKEIVEHNKVIVENFSYITILQVFILIAPFLTYPYLTRVLGTELYGLVLTAQMLASYATIIIRFGFDSVSSRHISINRDDKGKLSEIVSSILIMRVGLWVVSFILYLAIVLLIPVYRENFLLFLFSYGLTLNVLLFPQFFFQGIEKMKFITIINVIIQTIFIVLTFIVIKTPSDYIFVPLLHAAGYFIGGIISLYIILHSYGIKFRMPKKSEAEYYFKDALPLFTTDAVCTIKDKLNYLLLGLYVGMSDVVIYDVGSKLTSLAIQPLTIINTVLFPKMAKDRNDNHFKKIGLIVTVAIIAMVIVINIFLEPIVNILIGKPVPLLPVRILLLSPIFLGMSSYISSSLIVARGYNKYMFYSILVTTAAYVILLLVLFVLGQLNTVMSFIALTVVSYFVELLYRVFIANKILTKQIK